MAKAKSNRNKKKAAPPHPPDLVDESDSNGEDEVYTVEAIKAKRFDKLKNEYRYFIKWLGYGEADMTWEPAEVSLRSDPRNAIVCSQR
ncbi:hypothetical protein JCM10212_003237 [Sporobolomyces blumeae]